MTDHTPTPKLFAPFTSEQVDALNRFQEEGRMHPFTCDGDHVPGSPRLVAAHSGWYCPEPGCGYTQDWAHAFMADPEAWPAPAPATGRTSNAFEAAATASPAPKATQSPAPADATLRDRIAAALRNALKARTVPPIIDYLGRPITGTEIGLTEHELADIALTIVQPELDAARATNQRLNYRAQTAESRLNAANTAVANWRIDDQHTYVPLSSLNAIARAVGIDVAPDRWELHGQHVQALEATITRVRALAEPALLYDDVPQDRLARSILNALTPPAVVPCPTGCAVPTGVHHRHIKPVDQPDH